jgi:hypothetical protein
MPVRRGFRCRHDAAKRLREQGKESHGSEMFVVGILAVVAKFAEETTNCAFT